MKIEAEVTEEDIARFYNEYGFRNWIVRALVMLLIDLIICGYLQIFFLPMIVYGSFLFLGFFIIPYFISKRKLKRVFEKTPSMLGGKIYKPFAAGIEITDETGDTFLRYEAISSIGKTRNYVFMFLVGGKYYLLPKLSFSSFSEVDHFLQIAKSGINMVKGVRVKEPLTFKPAYLVGLICLIPLIGAIAGIIFIILGIIHYRDRFFIIIGAIGIVITVAVYGTLFNSMQNPSGQIQDGFAQIAQTQLNDLVKSIEFYKIENGRYPDSLQQVDNKESYISISDPLQAIKSNKKYINYQYQRIGTKYLLFSVGKDGIPDTKDDIYPTLGNSSDTSKLGFIRKKY